MLVNQPVSLAQCQRIDVALQGEGDARCYKITLERFDERLGWYQAGALSVPMHQLPLLQQALSNVNAPAEAAQVESFDKIVPFPMLMGTPAQGAVS